MNKQKMLDRVSEAMCDRWQRPCDSKLWLALQCKALQCLCLFVRHDSKPILGVAE